MRAGTSGSTPLSEKSPASQRSKASITSHGTSVTAEGPISSLTFTSCTSGWTVSVSAGGSLIAHVIGGGGGTLTTTGTTINAVNDSLGLTCRYLSNANDLGVMTGSAPGTATLHVDSTLARHGGSVFCGETVRWTGSYLVTTPDNLSLH